MLSMQTHNKFQILKANPSDNEVLTEITMKSKAYWGYSTEQMKAWADLLTISNKYIQDNQVYKLIIDNIVVGYYSFVYLKKNELKLDNLFIHPNYIGCGYGKALFKDFLDKIKDQQVDRVILESDPNAESFYIKLGFVQIGKIETTIKNRYLPLMEMKITHG